MIFLRLTLFSTALLILFSQSSASARGMEETLTTKDFRYVSQVSVPSLIVPTLAQIPLTQGEYVDDLMLVQSDGTVVHTLVTTDVYREPVVASSFYGVDAEAMTDGSESTFTEFPFEGEGQRVILTLTSDDDITADSLNISFAHNVVSPSMISINAVDMDGDERVVLAERTFFGSPVTFIPTTSSEWIVSLTLSQPLRISEVSLRPLPGSERTESMLRFLALPGETYSFYSGLEKNGYMPDPAGEQPNLNSLDNVLTVNLGNRENNARFVEVPSDIDTDGVVDHEDNCVTEENPDQADIDKNGRGDACDDFDRDGRIGALDNCPVNTNRYQTDFDNDGVGDACDTYDNRFTERSLWMPWLAIGFAALVLIVLAVLSRKGMVSDRV